MLNELTKQCVTMLDLSTAHVPSDPSFGGYRVVEHKYGYVVYVMSPERWETPEWLLPIMSFAFKNNCILINFDRDADIAKCLGIYH